MGNIARLQIPMSGSAVVGPAVMTLYQDAAHVGLPAAALTWLNALKANFPPGLTFTVPSGGDTMEETTGTLNGTWSDGGGGTVTGTGVGEYLLGTGVRVRWFTSGITGGRRVRGTTFLVPFMASSFDATGRLPASGVTAVQTATNTFLSTMGTGLVIWSRPRAAKPLATPPVTARAGSMHPVLSAQVPSLPTSLRSRRY